MYLNDAEGMVVKQFERLKHARIDAGFKSGTAAAEAMGISIATYIAHENGTRGLTLRSAEKYGKKFNVRIGWLMTGEEPMRFSEEDIKNGAREYEKDFPDESWGTFTPGKKYSKAPGVLPEIDLWAVNVDDEPFQVTNEWAIPLEFVNSVLQSLASNTFLLAAPDDTMAPLVVAGDRAFVDSSQTTFRGEGLYVIRDFDGQLYIRWLSKIIINPRPEGNIGVSTRRPNEVYFTNLSDLTIIGRVVGKAGKILEAH